MPGKYIGIDINESYAMLSYYTDGMAEPDTLSMVAGSKSYKIPLCIARKEETGEWFYGEDAKERRQTEGIVFAENLFSQALSNESSPLEGCDARELFFLFFKKLLSLAFLFEAGRSCDCLVMAAEHLTHACRELFASFAGKIGLSPGQFVLLEHKECFYYYALSQADELCLRDSALYDYDRERIVFWRLSCSRTTVPRVVQIDEKILECPAEEKDERFAAILKETLQGAPVSSVYLVGEGFDGAWMQKSLAVLLKGRRAFAGKNLYCKGACYAAVVKAGKKEWPYLYIGDNELKVNIGLRVEHEGRAEFYSLVDAGENWYESSGGACEAILEGEPCVDLWLRPPQGEGAEIRPLALTDLPRRPDRTTRLHIAAKPVAADQIYVRIQDMGFGEIAESSGKIWEYTVSVSTSEKGRV